MQPNPTEHVPRRRLTAVPRDVLTAVQALDGQPVTRDGLALRAGCSRSAATRALRILVDAGLIEQEPITKGFKVVGLRLRAKAAPATTGAAA